MPDRSGLVEITLPVPPHEFLSSELSGAPSQLLSQPASVDGFDCYAVNVYGPGISGPGAIPPQGGSAQGPGCSYLGASSLLTSSNQSVISLQVPSGLARSVQMIGLATGNGCRSDQTLAQYIMAANATTPPGSTPSYILSLLGQTTSDLVADTTITIQNTYAGSAGGQASYPFQCNSGTPTGPGISPLTLAPVQVYSGTMSTSGYGESVIASLPQTGMTAVSPADLTLLQNAGNATNVIYSTFSSTAGTTYQRMDAIFDVSTVDFTKYSYLSVSVRSAFAGQSSTSNSLPTGGTGGSIALYNGTASAWNTLTTAVGSASAADLNLSVGSVATPISAFKFNATAGPGTGPYLFVSYRSKDSNTASYSVVALKSIQITLMP